MATLKKIKKGQTVTEQVDLINENVENINVDLEKVVNNEAGYITEDAIPVKSVNSKTGDVSLSAKDVGAFPNSSSIRELDINNIKDTGVYIGTYATNPYYLIVIKYNDTNIYQELIGAKFKEYRRFTGTWSEWVKEYSTENPVKAGDIKGIEIVDTDKELSLALLEDTTFVKADIKYNPSSKSLYIGDEKFATEQFVRDAVNMVKSIIVAELPETGIANTIYFIPSQNPDTSNTFEEYIYVNGEWEIVGGTTIDLTPFLPREEAEQTYAKISSLDEKVSKTTTINGKTLYNNINLTAEDVGALPKDTILVEDVVYRHTNAEISGKLTAGAFVENDLVIAIDDGTYLKGHMYKYNSGTLTDITDIITDYVDLDSDQTINGTKNFNGILRYGGVNVATEDDLNEYLPLTAGSNKKLTGDLYLDNTSADKSLFYSAGAQIRGTTSGDLSISSKNGRNIFFRCDGTGEATTGIRLNRPSGSTIADFYPQTTGRINLGTSSNKFNNIHGTTIYQNGKQVANAEDIPSKVNANNPNIFIGYNSEENLNSFYQVAFKGNDQAKGICWSKFANISNGAEVNGTSSTRTPSGCTSNGFYYVTSSTNSLSGADANPFLQYHTSEADFRILTTAYSELWLQQIATDFRSPHIFVRRKENGTWQNWVKLASASDIPTIPTVNNGTLTIQQNGTTLGTFTANQSGDTTVNIESGSGGGGVTTVFQGSCSINLSANTTTIPLGVFEKNYSYIISTDRGCLLVRAEPNSMLYGPVISSVTAYSTYLLSFYIGLSSLGATDYYKISTKTCKQTTSGTWADLTLFSSLNIYKIDRLG